MKTRTKERTHRGVAGVRICLLGLAVQIVMSAATVAQAPKAVTGQQTPPHMDRRKEIALALSACPPAVADKAAVYVLENSGYVKVRDSQNGFTAIVQHALPSARIRSAWMLRVRARFSRAT